MKCSNCGETILNGNNVCQNCGTPVNNVTPTSEPAPANNAMPNSEPTPVNNVMPTVEPAPVNNGLNVQEQPQKAKKGIFKTVLLIIIAIIAFVGAYLLTNYLLNSNKGVDPIEEPPQVQPKKETPPVEEPEEKTKTISLGDYTFEIPSSMTTQTKGNGIILKADEWYMYLEIVSVSYDQIINNFSNVRSTFENLGYEVGEEEQLSYNNRNFIVVDVSNTSMKYLAAYSKYNENTVFCVELYNYNAISGFRYNYDRLEDVATILNTCKPN